MITESNPLTYGEVNSANIKKILEILFDDLGESFKTYILEINDSTSYLKIKTSYKSYTIIFNNSEETNIDNNGSEKIINISINLLEDKEKTKFFLRRQFIADEELFNLYLKRGKEVKPHDAQQKALFNLKESRAAGKNKAIAILATGLGKTILSALDVKQTKLEKILFIVHINEILKQTKESFERVIPEMKEEMGFYTGKQKHLESFPVDYFDYIIIDETHHTAAPTYTKIFNHFRPKFFLGLTATPDRMDRKDILGFYENNVVFEMNQEQAIEQGYLAPFQYLGFKDNIDYSNIYFNGFKYDTKDLNKHLLIDARDQEIINKFKEFAGERKTIGFCASIEHAERCAQKFNEAGINSIAVHSHSEGLDEYEDKSKEMLIKHFRQNKCQVAFVVDMFNEGVDIPDVSCLLFLRPTESKTIFIQHMGRGLRIAPKKENVLILDFIGNYRTANLILDGLNIKGGIRGLKKVSRNGKEFFVYNLNDCEIVFETEIIDIFKNNEVKESSIIKNDVIAKEWIEYSGYLEKWTKDNLYWKRGQQNQYFEVNFEGIKIIKENPNITEKDFVSKIQIIVNEKYKGKNMTAGFRALMISKITGFVTSDSPLIPTLPFNKIYELTQDFSKLEIYQDILTSQLEKILYWNPIYGSYNKYVDQTKRVSFKDFKIYPFFFIYDVLLRLIDDYGADPAISKFEFNTFIAITKEHSETQEVTERILRFRNDEEKHQTKKLLETKNNIDPRFYGIIHYNKYIEQDRNSIKLKPEYIDEIRNKVLRFREIYCSERLILSTEKTQKIYNDMLYSDIDILSYHEQQER